MLPLVVMVAFTCMFATFFTGCTTKRGPIMTSGDFRYCYINGTSGSKPLKDGNSVAVLQLTETGYDSIEKPLGNGSRQITKEDMKVT